jgi:hypothetical protein
MLQVYSSMAVLIVPLVRLLLYAVCRSPNLAGITTELMAWA